jgi:hypothetical protein
VYFDSVVASGLVLFIALFVSGFCLHRIRVLHIRPYRKLRRICRQILFSLAILVVLAVGCGTTFNALAIHHYRTLYPAQGSIYIMDGYKMHLYCTGEGSPTIVLDAGLGMIRSFGQRCSPSYRKQLAYVLTIAPDTVGATNSPDRVTPTGLPINCTFS